MPIESAMIQGHHYFRLFRDKYLGLCAFDKYVCFNYLII